MREMPAFSHRVVPSPHWVVSHTAAHTRLHATAPRVVLRRPTRRTVPNEWQLPPRPQATLGDQLGAFAQMAAPMRSVGGTSHRLQGSRHAARAEMTATIGPVRGTLPRTEARPLGPTRMRPHYPTGGRSWATRSEPTRGAAPRVGRCARGVHTKTKGDTARALSHTKSAVQPCVSPFCQLEAFPRGARRARLSMREARPNTTRGPLWLCRLIAYRLIRARPQRRPPCRASTTRSAAASRWPCSRSRSPRSSAASPASAPRATPPPPARVCGSRPPPGTPTHPAQLSTAEVATPGEDPTPTPPPVAARLATCAAAAAHPSNSSARAAAGRASASPQPTRPCALSSRRWPPTAQRGAGGRGRWGSSTRTGRSARRRPSRAPSMRRAAATGSRAGGSLVCSVRCGECLHSGDLSSSPPSPPQATQSGARSHWCPCSHCCAAVERGATGVSRRSAHRGLMAASSPSGSLASCTLAQAPLPPSPPLLPLPRHCGAPFLALRHARAHEQQCERWPVECPWSCGAALARVEAGAHASVCIREAVACAAAGCGARRQPTSRAPWPSTCAPSPRSVGLGVSPRACSSFPQPLHAVARRRTPPSLFCPCPWDGAGACRRRGRCGWASCSGGNGGRAWSWRSPRWCRCACPLTRPTSHDTGCPAITRGPHCPTERRSRARAHNYARGRPCVCVYVCVCLHVRPPDGGSLPCHSSVVVTQLWLGSSHIGDAGVSALVGAHAANDTS